MHASGEMDDRARALQRAVERGVVGRRKITDGDTRRDCAVPGVMRRTSPRKCRRAARR
jgi:hypothetical protein